MQERKKILMTLSKCFPLKHSRQREQTLFSQHLQTTLKGKQGGKIHTIRSNYTQWKHNLDKVINGDFFISVRQWTARPYHSSQEEIARIYGSVGYQSFEIRYSHSDESFSCKIDGKQIEDLELVARNDGLTLSDFLEWYFPLSTRKKDLCFYGIVIHFTDYRYV